MFHAAAAGAGEVVGRIRRALLLAALAAGSVGLLLSFGLSRRVRRLVEALTAAARRMAAGDLEVRVAGGGRDEIGELARAFNAMAERRAAAERLRRDLVNDVAHELRSPLTNLRAHLEALEDGLLAPTPETLASLGDEVRLLGRLVDELQDLALAEAGQLALERGPVDLAGEIERAVNAARPAADELGIRLETDLPASLPGVEGDARRLAQILRNLLGNALTHTPPGGRIVARARPGAGEGRGGDRGDSGAWPGASTSPISSTASIAPTPRAAGPPVARDSDSRSSSSSSPRTAAGSGWRVRWGRGRRSASACRAPDPEPPRRYLRFPGRSRPPWCRISPVTLPSVPRTNSISASTTLRK